MLMEVHGFLVLDYDILVLELKRPIAALLYLR